MALKLAILSANYIQCVCSW